MKNLGFGMMRLPVKNGNPTDFDYEQLNRIGLQGFTTVIAQLLL